MTLSLQKFSDLVESMAAGVQGAAAVLVDLSVGSVLRALVEACAAVALWMQWLILQVLLLTRAATSTGSDLDSWMADFSFLRLAGSASAGTVTFSRYTPGVGAVIPVGTAVSTSDGSETFSVVADPGNSAWNGSNGYIVAPMASGVTVAAQATQVGTSGNILPGTIGLLTTAIPGIDTVSNANAFAGGSDAESDPAARARFQGYINSRSLATVGAVEFAISSVQLGVRYVVLENVNTAGQTQPGTFWVVADDGTGSPPLGLLSNISTAVDSVRPIGSRFAVTGPAIYPVSIAMSVVTANPLTRTAVLGAIQMAVSAWIAGLPLQGTLAISKLEALAHDADASVVSVLSTTINGVASDFSASVSGVILATSVVVN